ncbi:hypothetical protein K7432_014362 [Basidiobolus ranarum]|uniref:Uncharacterized protein n=1 Tax=Basidiobolus ranarum TaxID=34480 RepID=A0ABR2WHQ9_9FUNG
MDPNTYPTTIPTSAMATQYAYYSDQQIQQQMHQRQLQQQQLQQQQIQQEQLRQLQQQQLQQHQQQLQQDQLQQQIQQQQVQELQQQQYVQKANPQQVLSQPPIAQSMTPPVDTHNASIYSLREILQEYSDKPDMLRCVLEAKVAEDKRKGEEERRKAEKLHLESKRIELEILKELRQMAASFTAPMAANMFTSLRNGIDSTGVVPGYSTSPNLMSPLKPSPTEYAPLGITPQPGNTTSLLPEQINTQQQMLATNFVQVPSPAVSLSISTSAGGSLAAVNRANSQPPRTPRQFPSPSQQRDSPQVDNGSDNGLLNNQAGEGDINPVNHKRGRSLSHAEVMEALRNKIRAKSKLTGGSPGSPSQNVKLEEPNDN